MAGYHRRRCRLIIGNLTLIDLIAYKIEAYDSDDFIEDLNEKKLKSIVVLFNPVKGYRVKGINITLETHQPPRIFLASFAGSKLKGAIYNLAFPALFFIDMVTICLILFRLIRRYRPQNGYTDNTYVAVFLAYLRKKNVIQNLVYAYQDWV